MVAFQNPQEFRDAVYAFQKARIILTAYELQIFTCLGDQALSSSDLARQAGLDPRACDRLMNALVVVGLLLKEQGLFSNTAFAERYLIKGKAEYLGGYGHTVNMWNTWTGLSDSVRTGTCAPREDKEDENWTRDFIAAMHHRAVGQADGLVSHLNLGGVKKMLDVGGGSGVYSMACIRAKPDIHAVVLDLPDVLEETKKYVKEAGLEDSFSYISGDYHTTSPKSGYDLILLSAIVHINSNDENVLLVKRCADALNPGGMLVIQDHVMDEDRTGPPSGVFFALNMLVATHRGDTFTESEIRSWMTNADLSQIEIIPTYNNALVIAKKA